MGANAVMLLTGAQALTTAVGQHQQAGAVLSQGRYHQRLAEWNANLAERQAADAVARGAKAEQRHRQGVKGLVGAQRAALAAQGIEINDGSALDVQADTVQLGELDALTLRNNAAREAWGYKAQASDERQRGIMAGLASRNEAAGLRTAAFGTLLTGAANVYGMSRGGGRSSSKAKAPKAKGTFGVDGGGKAGGYV
jgi:hypothetical protein